ncbi:hypothetical protein GCM10010912_18030 [Paenibacillus albidus]|uniref:Uncharacterized protein n=1 Tax=Paenibacillus albidus TaxID=2041023 RepID=A0A917C5K3_9BACL|nr:hypothetical protein [Paenibacillus albidus]GGF73218.1 hypothetical protein GCM10010912_18030 [Paenibacillus albidus]
MTAKEIILMQPGEELDELFVKMDDQFSPSTNMNDAWRLRNNFLEHYGGNFKNERFCDTFPEHCSWEDGGRVVLVWSETGPEAISKTIALAARGYFGDFHPWVLFPELQAQFIENLKKKSTLFR